MILYKFIPELGIRGAHWCPVLLPFNFGSPSLSTGRGWILHSNSELPCCNSNVLGSSAPTQCLFRGWIRLMIKSRWRIWVGIKMMFPQFGLRRDKAEWKQENRKIHTHTHIPCHGECWLQAVSGKWGPGIRSVLIGSPVTTPMTLAF